MKYKYHKKLQILELINSNTSVNSVAKISLNKGGSLQELILNNKLVIGSLEPLKYENTYASSILFPFANRIKNGKYSFNQKKYNVTCNDEENNNAMHGFVFNKQFNVVSKEITKNFIAVTLEYTTIKREIGFPFLYSVFLTYTLYQNSINLKVTIKNLDENSFPFTIGWHPYFSTTSLYNSILNFKSNQKIVLDNNMITKDVLDIKNNSDIQIKDQKFDDCYILHDSKVNFKTPTYDLEINSSIKDFYLQIYTPNKDNTIAIEPTTGPSNSFNNKLGLQILESRKSYTIGWTVKLNNTN